MKITQRERRILAEAQRIKTRKLNEALLNRSMISTMSPEEQLYTVERFLKALGPKIRERIENLQADAYEQLEEARLLDKAWKSWNYKNLLRHGMITQEELETLEEILGEYTY